MYKRSIFDPELLFLGLEDFAEQESVIDEVFKTKNDSLILLSQQLIDNKNKHGVDLENIKTENTNRIKNLKSNFQLQKYLFLFFGLVGGGILFFVFGKFRK